MAEGFSLLTAALPSSLDALGGLHSFRVDYIKYERGWAVKAHGKYVAVCATERDALRWLAGFLIELSCVPQHEKAKKP